MASGNSQLTALLIGGTGATGKEVLKELNKSELISKIIFISRRALKFPDQPKVRIATRGRQTHFHFDIANLSFIITGTQSFNSRSSSRKLILTS